MLELNYSHYRQMSPENPTQPSVAEGAIPNLSIQESLGSLGLIAGILVIELSWANLSSLVGALFVWLTIGGNLLKAGKLKMFDSKVDHLISLMAHQLTRTEKIIVWVCTLAMPPLALLFIALWYKKSYYKARQANLIALAAFVPWLFAVMGVQLLLPH
jgi:hypothetical protein